VSHLSYTIAKYRLTLVEIASEFTFDIIQYTSA